MCHVLSRGILIAMVVLLFPLISLDSKHYLITWKMINNCCNFIVALNGIELEMYWIDEEGHWYMLWIITLYKYSDSLFTSFGYLNWCYSHNMTIWRLCTIWHIYNSCTNKYVYFLFYFLLKLYYVRINIYIYISEN